MCPEPRITKYNYNMINKELDIGCDTVPIYYLQIAYGNSNNVYHSLDM